MLICDDQVRLTRDEKHRLQRAAAKNCHAVNEVATVGEALDAHLKGLPALIAEDMLAFFERGTSRLTEASFEALREHLQRG